jgi:hypothetical protein
LTPVEPTEPVEPAEPVEPTEPTEPTEPAEPTEPTEPTEDTERELERLATAAVLSTGAPVSRGALVLALAGVAGAAVSPAWPPPARLLLAVSLALGLAQGWYALRVAVDARLFALAALPAHLAALDRVLARLRGSAPPAGRGFDERSRAALRLWRRQVTLAFLQALCLVAAATWWLAAR